MKKLYALSFLALFASLAFGQFNYKNALKLSLFGPYNLAGKPGLELHYERFWKPKQSLNVELTYINDPLKLYTFYDYIENWKGASIAFSNRFSLSQKSGLAKFREKPFVWRMFMAPGFGLSHTKRDLYWDFFYDEVITYRDYFTIRRNELLAFVDGGFTYNIGRITVEYFVGLGYMFRYVKHLERDYLNDKPKLDAEYYLSEYESPRNYNIPMIRYKIGVGYNFN